MHKLAGKKFGRLTVLQRSYLRPSSAVRWKCLCICGNTCHVVSTSLVRGLTKSCGCLQREAVTRTNKVTKFVHGCSAPEYRIWRGIRERCLCKTDKSYPDYGGRGISIDKRWNNFLTFRKDMGPRPFGCQIDRIDNSKGYSKKNCRWATLIVQARNKRNNKLMTLNSKTKTMIEWSEILSISYLVLKARVKLGWSDTKALTTPVRRHK